VRNERIRGWPLASGTLMLLVRSHRETSAAPDYLRSWTCWAWLHWCSLPL